MRCYLDIDGVLLEKGGKPAEGWELLLDFALGNFDCYWSTTHCRGGDATTALRYLSRHLPAAWVERLGVVKPSTWDVLKTDAFDWGEAFVWLEDQPMRSELEVLGRHGMDGSLWIVDLGRRHELVRVVAWMQLRLEG